MGGGGVKNKGQLPSSWVYADIAALAKIEMGQSPDSIYYNDECDGLPFFQGKTEFGPRYPVVRKWCSEPKKVAEAGDILLSIRAPVGPSNIALERSAIGRGLAAIGAETSVSQPYLFYFFRHIESWLSSQGTGSTFAAISGDFLRAIQVPVAPAAEQTRIVAKLEELLSDLDAGVAELKAAQKKLVQYRQSLLKAAVEGALTSEWRAARSAANAGPAQVADEAESGAQLLSRILTERRSRWQTRQLAKFQAQGKTPPKDWQAKYPEPVAPYTKGLPELPVGWVWATVEQLGDIQLGRQRSPDKVTGLNPAPYIRAANITEQGIDFSDVLEMDFNDRERETFQLKSGDVLLTEASGSPQHVGRPVIWPNVEGLYCFQNTVIRFSPLGVTSEFAFQLFSAWQKLGVFRRLSGGVGINHLSAGKFSALAVPLPSVDEQTELVRALSVAFDSLASQEQTINYSLKQSAAQRKNILQAAFSGQLVPQDPADEPASALLAQIRVQRAERAARASSAKAKKSKPSSKRNSPC